MPNPFFVGQAVPPQRFVGRTSELDAAFDQIHNRSHMAIWGGPGMGKTSFLEKLASTETWQQHRLDSSSAVIVLVSCGNIIPFTPAGFWREVLSLLREKLDREPAIQANIDTLLANRTTKESLRQVLRKLGQSKKFLVLLIDDYDAALQTNEEYTEAEMELFLSECRSLSYHSQERKYLSMIVASLKRLNELGPKLNLNKSPWYNHYLFQSLKPFNDTEFDQLLGIQKTPGLDKDILELRKAIREIAGGHPAMLQIAGSFLYREVRGSQGQVLDAQDFSARFESDTKQFFDNTWRRCNEVEKNLLMLIALMDLKGRLHKNKKFDLSDIDIIFSQKERDLTNLEEQGVIIRKVHAGKSEYSFTSSIMKRLVVQELWNTNNLQDREKIFFNPMSHGQAKKITNTIQWLWKNKDQALSAIEWSGKLLAALPTGAIKGLFNWK
ncbi:ATP-binding protein [Limnofasciculus baicalensis]|uniref:ATP-binding protein n=1 Tax=Limnofasciculus baicalensis BBK-W-15 TaxID=2699891 RepID=A0AAE3GU42_9CYAN|nr:ATP-binding protein [Limnofasciculus baicalensis]MCP2730519.1 ATP-binding protein [Limnofasciculus baicalensis BBK-W-15]